MSDITTCPKCHAELNVSSRPGEALVCSRCGYTATKPMSLPAGDDRDLDVRKAEWRTAHKVLLVLAIFIVVPAVIFFAACGVLLWSIH